MHSARTLPEDHARVRSALESRAIGGHGHLGIVNAGDVCQNFTGVCNPQIDAKLEMGFGSHDLFLRPRALLAFAGSEDSFNYMPCDFRMFILWYAFKSRVDHLCETLS